MRKTEADWILLVRFPGPAEVWGVQIGAIEVREGARCVCEETGAEFEVATAGLFNSAAAHQGKRIVEFTHISGDRALIVGYRMVPLGDDMAAHR